MKDRKYEFTGETMLWKGRTLHRIRAVRDFLCARKGELGGWIEKEENLSHDGICWVEDEAKVFENASVEGHATINENALVYGSAKIHGCSVISGKAEIHGRSEVRDNAIVMGNSMVFDSAIIGLNTIIVESAIIGENAKILSNLEIFGSPRIAKNADIHDYNDILCVGPIESKYITFYKAIDNSIMIAYSGYNLVLEDFESLVEDGFHEELKKSLKPVLQLAKERFSNL